MGEPLGLIGSGSRIFFLLDTFDSLALLAFFSIFKAYSFYAAAAAYAYNF